MPRTRSLKMVTETGPKTTSKEITIKDNGVVVGRATVSVQADGKVFVYLLQTYGGAREGTLDATVKCDLDVLQAVCEEAEGLAEGS